MALKADQVTPIRFSPEASADLFAVSCYAPERRVFLFPPEVFPEGIDALWTDVEGLAMAGAGIEVTWMLGPGRVAAVHDARVTRIRFWPEAPEELLAVSSYAPDRRVFLFPPQGLPEGWTDVEGLAQACGGIEVTWMLGLGSVAAVSEALLRWRIAHLDRPAASV